MGEALLDNPVTSLSTLVHVTDHFGSPRAALDAAGTVVEARDYYYPFGLRLLGHTVTEATPAAEDYTDHELDPRNQPALRRGAVLHERVGEVEHG